MDIKLFDQSNIDELRDSDIKDFLLPFVKDGIKNYIDNVDTDLKVLLVDDLIIPITINASERGNSHVCSPFSHYIKYCEDQLPKKAFFFLSPLINLLGKIFKAGKIDQVVIVNNWMVSTNLYPELSSKQIERIKNFLVATFKDHTILFRSLSKYQLPHLIDKLQKEKFDLIPSRIVFFTNHTDQKAYSSRMFKSDVAVLKKSPYEIVPLNNEDCKRAEHLYHMLNIEKHSSINPQFNARFIGHANKFFTFKGLKKEGRLDAVIGYFSQGNVMTSPFFGYDTSLPTELGLYRQLSTILLQDAKGAGMLLHQSSGAGNYKKLRRAEPEVEYMAVYTGHLPLSRKIPWKLLKYSMNTIGLKFMQKLS